MKCRRLVIGVEYVDCSSLSSLTRTGTRSVKVADDVPWQNIKIKVPASLVSANKTDNKVTLYNSELKFYTHEEIEFPKMTAFRVTILGGEQLLIGTDGRPYASIVTQQNMPSSVTENQMNEVTVTYESTKNLPNIQ